MTRGLCRAALALALVSSLSLPSRAEASDVVKGMIGGGMLGAEAVLLTESALRLRAGWVYLVGGAAGAAGGAYLGRELCDDGSNRPPAFLLAGGIALIIPSIMGVLTATQYAPSGPLQRDAQGNAAVNDAAEDNVAVGDARLSLPSLGLAQAFSREELARFRLRQTTELHLTFLRGVF